jgi:hypothetical protein
MAFTEKPSWAWAALEPRETVELAVPLRGLVGDVEVTVEVGMADGSEAEVALSLGESSRTQVLLPGPVTRLSVSNRFGSTELVLRLKAGANAKACTVMWRSVRVKCDGVDTILSLWPGSRNADDCPPPALPTYRPGLEQALIEWDWRMQDGIGTERAPTTFKDATERNLRRGNALLQDWQARGFDAGAFQTRWRSLSEQWQGLATLPSAEPMRWEALWRATHQARREIVLANPLFKTRPLVFVKQAPSVFSHQLTQYYGSCLRPGGGVFILDQPGRSMACRMLAPGALPQGSYQHLDVSADGKRLLVSYCPVATTPRNREEHLDRYAHLYEIEIESGRVKQLTDGPYDDFSPRYLPGGGLVFVSTRRGGFHRCGRGPCPVYTLCVAETDGADPRPISWHETHEWDPAVLHDGRIAYTRWDYVDRHAVYYEQLWSVRPDGSGVRILYGNNTFNPVGTWEARAVPNSDLIMATAGAHHAMTAGSIILVDTAQEPDGLAPLTRLTPDALFPESEAPVIQKPNGFWSAGLGRGPAVPAEAVRWPGHCYRSPYPLAEKYFLAAYSFDPLIGEPTWNRANMFGLYLVDAFGNKELIYRDLNISSQWPALLEPPPILPRLAAPRDTDLVKEGTFFLQNVNASWPALPVARIHRLRIVQVLPKSTPHANTPAVGLPNASPGRQVLGTVPVEPDGSAWFRAPANLPLSFQALDERGQAVQIMRSVAYLQPGETAGCIGCHEHRTTAPTVAQPALALGRAPSAITPGPDGSNPLSYPLLVQPVLDRHCVRCHNPGKPENKVVLTGDPQGPYTASYHALASRVSYSAWGGKPGDFRQANSEPLSRPEFFGARSSKLMQKLLAGHSDVKLSNEDVDRLVTWMDANVLFYGTFDPADQTRQLRGERIAGPKVQ